MIDFAELPDRSPYLVMEYLEGVELAAFLEKTGALPMVEVVSLVEQIAAGLAAAHEKGIVHRDLKPQNIFLLPVAGRDKRLVKIVDFGISKVRAARTSLTHTATVMGTPQYMSPEQASGLIEEIDHRTDQFALAAITYEMISGRAAFRGESLPALMFQVVHGDPLPLGTSDCRPAPMVERVVRRGLAKKKEDRYQSVLEFADALDAAWRRGETSENATVAGSHAALTGTMPFPRPAQMLSTPPSEPWVGTGAGQSTTLRGAASEVEADLEAAGISSPRRRRFVMASALGLGVLGVAAAYILFVTGPAPATPPISASAARPIVEIKPPPLAPAPVLAPPPANADNAKADNVIIDVTNGPPGLVVRVDGERWELPVRLPRGGRSYRFRFEAPGFESEERRIDTMNDRVVPLAMTKLPAKSNNPHRVATRVHPAAETAAPPAPAPAPAAAKHKVVTDL